MYGRNTSINSENCIDLNNTSLFIFRNNVIAFLFLFFHYIEDMIKGKNRSEIFIAMFSC